MYTLQEATCDCCATIFRAINKKHYCPHCDRFYFVCSRCHEKTARCPSCGIPLKRKSAPLRVLQAQH